LQLAIDEPDLWDPMVTADWSTGEPDISIWLAQKKAESDAWLLAQGPTQDEVQDVQIADIIARLNTAGL